MTSCTYAPSVWLGTRLTSDALRTKQPYTVLAHACREGEERLRRLAGFVAGMTMEVDWLDKDAELRRRQLATVARGRRMTATDRPYTSAAQVHVLAQQLWEASTARDRSADFLRRLLVCYRAATSYDVP